MKTFYRVHIVLNDCSDERIDFGFDFDDHHLAANFASLAFKAECAYNRVYMECLEYDPSDMTTVDAPCWRNLDE